MAAPHSRSPPVRVLQTVTAGDLAITLSNPSGALRQGANNFRIEFRSARTNTPVNVGDVRLNAAMTMPGMAMTGTTSMTPGGRPGVYEAKGDFAMSGSWDMTLEWNGPAGRGSAAFKGACNEVRIWQPGCRLCVCRSSDGLSSSCSRASANAVAQDGTIEQLVATALERSPEIRAARTAITAAGGQLTQAGLRPNPTLSGSQMLMTGAQHQTLLEVEWPLDLFRRAARVGTAQRTPSKRRRWAFRIASACSPPRFAIAGGTAAGRSAERRNHERGADRGAADARAARLARHRRRDAEARRQHRGG